MSWFPISFFVSISEFCSSWFFHVFKQWCSRWKIRNHLVVEINSIISESEQISVLSIRNSDSIWIWCDINHAFDWNLQRFFVANKRDVILCESECSSWCFIIIFLSFRIHIHSSSIDWESLCDIDSSSTTLSMIDCLVPKNIEIRTIWLCDDFFIIEHIERLFDINW